MYWAAKSGILTMLLGSSLLALTAGISDYWVSIPSKSLHMGLFRICNDFKECDRLVGTGHVVNLLIAVFIIGILTLPCGILEVWYAKRGRLGTLSYIMVISFILTILEFAALVHGAVLISNFLREETYHYSWSFAVGWISVITAAATGVLSFYINRVEPPNPVTEGQAEAGAATVTQSTGNPAVQAITQSSPFTILFQKRT